MVKIYDLFQKEDPLLWFNAEQIKQIIKGANENGFLLIQDGYRSVPRKILTTIGIIEIVLDIEEESRVVSKHTEETMYYENRFGFEYVGSKVYKMIADNLLVYLYSKPKVLLDYINTKYNLNLIIEDIKLLDLKIETRKKDAKITELVSGIKRNNRKIKEKTYVKVDNGIIELKNNKINTMYI